MGKTLAVVLGVPLGIGVGLVAAAAILLGVFWLHERSINAPKGPYVAHNMQIVRNLPRIAGAKLRNSYSIGEPDGFDDNGWPYRGYTTYVFFQLAASAPQTNCTQVVAFYRSNLFAHGWYSDSPGVWRQGIGGPLLTLFCDSRPPLTYGFSVNYKPS